MSWEGPSQWSQTISHWKWYIRRALQVPHPGSSICSFSYSDMMWPSNIDQGRKCCLQMHWAGGPHELLGKSNWIWESITLPSARPGEPNLRKLWGKIPFLAQCTNWLSKGGHTKEGILHRWPGCTGTSDDQLSTDEGLLLMGPRIVILSCLHEEYLERLHQGHLSAMKVQQNTHEHLYWPGLDADIADYTRRCQECIHQSQPPKEPLQAHNVPQESWERIAMDYFYMNGRLYIIFWSVITLASSPSCFRSRPQVLPTWRTI